MHGPVEDANFIALLQVELLAEDDITVEDYRRNASRRLESEPFTDSVVQIVEIEAGVDCDAIFKPLLKRKILRLLLLAHDLSVELAPDTTQARPILH